MAAAHVRAEVMARFGESSVCVLQLTIIVLPALNIFEKCSQYQTTHFLNFKHMASSKSTEGRNKIKIFGIDTSAAFETINRCQLLDIVKTIVDEDEHRLLQFLLSGTVVGTRINGTSTSKLFTSNVGTPQRDSLNPVIIHCKIRTCSQRSPTYTAETNNLI